MSGSGDCVKGSSLTGRGMQQDAILVVEGSTYAFAAVGERRVSRYGAFIRDYRQSLEAKPVSLHRPNQLQHSMGSGLYRQHLAAGAMGGHASLFLGAL